MKLKWERNIKKRVWSVWNNKWIWYTNYINAMNTLLVMEIKWRIFLVRTGTMSFEVIYPSCKGQYSYGGQPKEKHQRQFFRRTPVQTIKDYRLFKIAWEIINQKKIVKTKMKWKTQLIHHRNQNLQPNAVEKNTILNSRIMTKQSFYSGAKIEQRKSNKVKSQRFWQESEEKQNK